MDSLSRTRYRDVDELRWLIFTRGAVAFRLC